jgi:mannosyltransferase OCH1-like enzyme
VEKPLIHTAWLSGQEVPQQFRDNWATQQAHGRWKLWTPQELQRDARLRWCLYTPYFVSCMKAKHWAAASDLARLLMLYEHGGIWLDGDVSVLKPLDRLMDGRLHVGEEDPAVYGTAVIAAPAKHPVIRYLISSYLDLEYKDLYEGGGNTNGPTNMTGIINALLKNPPTAAKIAIEPREVFYPSHYANPKAINITENTLTWHQWAASWRADADLTKWGHKLP